MIFTNLWDKRISLGHDELSQVFLNLNDKRQ